MWESYSTNQNSFAECLASNYLGWTVNDVSMPGATSSQVLTDVLMYAQSTPHFGGINLNLIWCNLNNDGTPITNTYQADLGVITNNMIKAAQAIQTNSDGLSLIVIPPSNPFMDTNGERFAYSNWVFNCAQQAGYNNFLNFASDPHMGLYTQYVNTAYFPTAAQPHLTNSGILELNQSYIVPVSQATINPNNNIMVTTNAPPPTSSPWLAATPSGQIFVSSNSANGLIWQQH
jgi:hypothetical protein